MMNETYVAIAGIVAVVVWGIMLAAIVGLIERVRYEKAKSRLLLAAKHRANNALQAKERRITGLKYRVSVLEKEVEAADKLVNMQGDELNEYEQYANGDHYRKALADALNENRRLQAEKDNLQTCLTLLESARDEEIAQNAEALNSTKSLAEQYNALQEEYAYYRVIVGEYSERLKAVADSAVLVRFHGSAVAKWVCAEVGQKEMPTATPMESAGTSEPDGSEPEKTGTDD